MKGAALKSVRHDFQIPRGGSILHIAASTRGSGRRTDDRWKDRKMGMTVEN